MDSIDRKIIEILQKNGRQKASEISNQVHLSVSSVIERIRRLEREGIIQGYKAQINPKALGYDMFAYMGVTLAHSNKYESFIEGIKKNSCVLCCNYVTGEYDFIIKIASTSTEKLEKIHKEIMAIENVQMVKTFFVLSNVKNQDIVIPSL